MNNLEQRLITCFKVVFPSLSDVEARQAEITSLQQWDSIATVMLINVIEEEFSIRVDLESADDFSSFRRSLAYLEEHVS